MRKVVIIGIVLLTVVMLTLLTASWLATDPETEEDAPRETAASTDATASPQPEETETPTPTPSMLAFDRTDWRLRLVNADNELPADFAVQTAEVEGYLFDARAADALQSMLDGGRADGVDLIITSAYRTYDYQQGLFQNKVQRVMAEQGVSQTEAEPIAAMSVARPGTSEHCLGLAVDIITSSYTTLDSGFAETDAAKWLYEHCAEYGFILRYPEDKTDVTGIIYEPWHFRYVGVEAAEYIMENGLTLEEFLGEA